MIFNREQGRKAEAKTFVQDMTQGSVTGHLVCFFLPMMAGNLFQQLYNIVDSIVIGRFEGANTLAAVGMVGSISYLFFALCEGLAGGIGILVAQYFGAREYGSVNKTVANAVYISLGTGLVMSILSVVLAKPILTLMNTPQESYEAAFIYMRIVCGGSIVVAIYATISSIMRAMGDSKTPLIFLVVASVINIILDIVFVYWLHMGAAGVAWATVIAQFVSAVGSLFFGYRTNPYLRPGKEYFRISKKIVKNSFALGIPLALQTAMMSISHLAIQFVVNGYGAMVMAAYTASMRVFTIVRLPMGVLGSALASFAGQNAGAGYFERVNSSIRKSAFAVTVYGVISMGAMVLLGTPIIKMFVNEPEVIEIGTRGLKIASMFFIINGLTNVFRASLNGVGDASFTMFNGILEIATSVIIVFSLTQIPFIGMWGIWTTSGIAELIAGFACWYRVTNGKWKKNIINSK